jgi:NAD(P)-dependent dehydrogenase (short-subunit alcohol dehydrogenase family)
MKTRPTVLITGASQGIGASIAKVFAQEVAGVRLALVARNERNLNRVASACGKAGAVAEVFRCDVTDETDVAAMAAAVTKRFGVVDVLVNNAGIFEGGPMIDMPVAQFDRVVAASLRSTFLVSRAFLPGMLGRGRGDVFNLSSIAGLKAYPGGAAYCAAKFGLTGLTRVMREEMRDKGVRVCGVFPGATWTPSWEATDFKPERMMPAEDIARAILAVYRLDRRTVVEDLVLRPQLGDV